MGKKKMMDVIMHTLMDIPIPKEMPATLLEKEHKPTGKNKCLNIKNP
jgi:hypothetical protein